MKEENPPTFIILTIFTILRSLMAVSDQTQDTLLRCLTTHSQETSPPISSLTYFPNNSSYPSVLRSYIRNLKFSSETTPKPAFIVAAKHVGHIRATILCCKTHGIQLRIRSGGHDYDGLSYVSDEPFALLDMFNLRSVQVDVEEGTAWVDSGSTLGELYHAIASKSSVLGFPGGVCPTVGVGGHFSGGGYGNMMRKYGVSTDHVVDAVLVNANGDVLDRKSMEEDLFWAIRGGGGASFGVIVSWKVNLVPVPEIVTAFRVERTKEDGLTDIVMEWQDVADNLDEGVFIRVVLMPVNKKAHRTVKGKFVCLFLGDAKTLGELMDESLPKLGLKKEDYVEMSWAESLLYWSNYPSQTSLDVLLERQPNSAKYLKKKSDYVQTPIPREGLEGLWLKMMELRKPALTFNPYGGKMSRISELDTAFPHRSGNKYKIQYSVQWKEDDPAVGEEYLERIRRLYEHMTQYVSDSPRCSYLNYRDVDLGTNGVGYVASYEEASVWGRKYFKGNLDRLVKVKTNVDPDNFFRYEQSLPSLGIKVLPEKLSQYS